MAAWQRVAIKLPKRFGPLERQAIAQEVIDFIIKRTQDGKGIKGNNLPGPYSDAYRSSLDYKNAGKPKSGKPVDLTLTGEMLNSLGLLSDASGRITIGYPKGDDINGKVEGNRLGSYGGAPNSKRARDFLGISESDLQKILSQYPEDRSESKDRAITELAAAKEAGNIVEGIEFDLGEDD